MTTREFTRQNCWAKYNYQSEASEWLRSLDVGDIFLHPSIGVHYTETDVSGKNFVNVVIKSIHNRSLPNAHVIISHLNQNIKASFDRKFPIKYAFAVRPVDSISPNQNNNNQNEKETNKLIIKQQSNKIEMNQNYKSKRISEIKELKRILNDEKTKRVTIKKKNKKLTAQMNEYEKQNKILLQEISKLKMENNSKFNVLNENVGQRINILNLEQLNELELIIQNAKQRLLEEKLYCLVCMDNYKNVVIMGCNHYVLCDKCEQKLKHKICPICQSAFTSIIKLQI
eukprot:194755_1